ncbi:MAG TPA: pseudouridine synthase [Burkholderiales bacterium]|nr:pseudouridine synthase [Burkholderiales bacterium]
MWGFDRWRSCRRSRRSPRRCSWRSSPLAKPRSRNPKHSPPPAPTAERVQKLLAATGLGSRREIENWISAGRVSVNGRLAKLGGRAGPSDSILLDGKPVRVPARTPTRVLLYHKPIGELVTRSDPQGRPTVFSSLPPGRWIAVGRLDVNSSGLLLFTDSGELANRLMHPRYGFEREYSARIRGALSAAEEKRLLQGIPLDGVPARFESIRGEREGKGANRWYRVVLKEGRNREVRRLFDALGHPVSRLVRLRYGPIELPADLPPQSWRELRNLAILQRL